MRLSNSTFGELIGEFSYLPRRVRWGEIGIEDDGTIRSDAPMQLLLVQTAVHTVTDTFDPFGRPDSSSISTQFYACAGKFAADPDFSDRVPGGSIEDSTGFFNVYGEVDSVKKKFTAKTWAQLTTVFEQAGGDTTFKSFYVGNSLADDTVGEMSRIDIVRVVPDFIIDAVQVTVKKRSVK